VIIDDQMWDGEIGDSVHNKFASVKYWFYSEEPLYNSYPVKLMEASWRDSRNIILIKKKRWNGNQDEVCKPQNVFCIGKVPKIFLI
jgi:hypothetical protein